MSQNITLENSGDSSQESGIVEELPDEGIKTDFKHDDDEPEVECPRVVPEVGQNFVGVEEEDTVAASSPFSFTSGTEGEQDESKKDVKKLRGFDAASSQRRRRTETLQWQKQRRDEILDKIRHLEDSAYSDSETEDEMDFVQSVRQTSATSNTELEDINEEVAEEMDVSGSKGRRKSHGGRKKHRNKHGYTRSRQAPLRPMMSEWLLEKPDDFEDMWLGVVCPAGKRCIVLASRGKTKVFSRTDEYLGCYKSLLPGGCRYNYRDNTTNRNRGVTILDCIWSPQSETFYVLDLICWNSHSCINCDTDYRQFFLHSKFSENLELLERSAMNPFPFKPLPFFSACEMQSIMSSPIMFPEDVDGILLFHKEAFYISETNPLCLWILLTQVESLLNIPVAPELLSRQKKPKNLSSRKKQIKKRNSNQQQPQQEMEISQ